ncbi:altronate dehydratase family protein [Daejeonella sp. JGW-45]|uniref:UxaA family hydrolase n=1 Tax=Daejeonella sp. JGW-45 TaxID=3034148 RepID=UPI0023EB7635|nr:altronate dehydratase family protein [Daejeonella sp. JGW-45]
MKQNNLKVHPDDNIIVALTDLKRNDSVTSNGETIVLQDDVKAKHKFTALALPAGSEVIMYGVLVGIVQTDLPKGSLITTENVKHAANDFEVRDRKLSWNKPDTSRFEGRSFMGFHRSDGSVGTANYWLVIPMVFCENRNLEVLQESLVAPLGYGRKKKYYNHAVKLINMIREGGNEDALLNAPVFLETGEEKQDRVFPNIDGVKFLVHDGGCGGIRQDSETLCGLLAGYITHPNVAGATVLSLGCQNAQVSALQAEIKKRSPSFDKPLYILDQQTVGTEADLLSMAIKQTLAGLIQANRSERRPAPLSKLCIGLECGGSDGFSGISANPAIGYTSDLLVAMGGSVILSEFPELCGVEQNLSDRCVDTEQAARFSTLMRSYSKLADDAGSGFYMNPSPGNIKDGLITDAIKSAGAAKKGGTSPVVEVLDYPEKVSRPGLSLLCTPGNDVESTTAEVGSGANLVLFTTGLGTPTGNPIAPVVKIATNTALFNKMRDIIDINTGSIIEGEETIAEAGERILDYVISVASGETEIAAVKHGQDDFIPWKRGISL